MLTILAVAYHVASRLAYVVGVGVALTRQDRHQAFTRVDGIEAGFRRFRTMAAWLMNNDAASFVVLCIITRQKLSGGSSSLTIAGTGLLLIVIGVSVKLWAAARLGAPAYYWHNFFVPAAPAPLVPPGPYRYLNNPMYTVGYLHAYGFALLTGSGIGLAAAAFDQIAILTFHAMVEKPHFTLLIQRSSTRQHPARAESDS